MHCKKKISIAYGRIMIHSFRLGVGKSILIVSFQKSKMADHFSRKIYKQFHFNMHCKKVSTTSERMMAHSFLPDVSKYILIVSFQKSKMADHFVGKIYLNSTLTCIATKISITSIRMVAHSFRLHIGKCLLILSLQKSKMADQFCGKIYK